MGGIVDLLLPSSLNQLFVCHAFVLLHFCKDCLVLRTQGGRFLIRQLGISVRIAQPVNIRITFVKYTCRPLARGYEALAAWYKATVAEFCFTGTSVIRPTGTFVTG